MADSQKPTLSLQTILQQDSATVLDWVGQNAEYIDAMRSSFNWLGLAEALAANASHANSKAEALAWAQGAILIFERLRQTSTAESKYSFLNSQLHLRSLMITRYGQVDGNPVLDIHTLLELFSQNLPMSYADAQQYLQRHTLSFDNIDEIRMLRQIKNMLSALEPLATGGTLGSEADVNRWLEMRGTLP